MERAGHGLRAAQAVYAANKSVRRSEFRSYVSTLDLAREYPGVVGLGFIRRVMRDDLDKFVAQERAMMRRIFAVTSTGDAPDLFVVKFIDPLESNARLGDSISGPTGPTGGINRAIESGEPTLTSRIYAGAGRAPAARIFVSHADLPQLDQSRNGRGTDAALVG